MTTLDSRSRCGESHVKGHCDVILYEGSGAMQTLLLWKVKRVFMAEIRVGCGLTSELSHSHKNIWMTSCHPFFFQLLDLVDFT